MKSLGFLTASDEANIEATADEQGWEIQQYVEGMWHPATMHEVRKKARESVEEVIEPEERKPPDKQVMTNNSGRICVK